MDRLAVQPDAAAVDAAAAAFEGWRRTPITKRAAILNRAADHLEARADHIAREITREMGKSLGLARDEVLRSAQTLRFYAVEGQSLTGEVFPNDDADMTVYTLREPLGVVSVITPWNFPISIPARKIAPAIAALVRDHNAQALDQIAATGRSTSPIVIPHVVYLDDEPGEDLLRDIGRPIAEVAAPTQIHSPAHAQLSSWRSLGQRITNEFRFSCGATTQLEPDPVCAQALQAVTPADSPPRYFLTVAPPTEPSVRAPLGWVFSDESHDSLGKHLQQSGNSGCALTASNLCDLVQVVGPR